MFIFAVLLLVGTIDQLLADPPPCTKEDLCRPVPPEVCNNSLCVPIEFSDLAEIGNNGGQIFTWNIGLKWLLEYGPNKWDISKMVDCGKTSHILTFPHCTEQPCSSPQNMSWTWYGEPDQNTGKYTVFTSNRAGDTYEDCFTSFKPGQAFVHRSCRVDPPPNEQACASIYAVEIASGDCEVDSAFNNLNEFPVYYGKEIVDCWG